LAVDSSSAGTVAAVAAALAGATVARSEVDVPALALSPTTRTVVVVPVALVAVAPVVPVVPVDLVAEWRKSVAIVSVPALN
jgi:hypothetical protein